jgi:hypothetical protein
MDEMNRTQIMEEADGTAARPRLVVDSDDEMVEDDEGEDMVEGEDEEDEDVQRAIAASRAEVSEAVEGEDEAGPSGWVH